ncbi:hypothetical protein AB7G19_30080 [Bradyrhizobium sp. 215_C5_N1_1]|uniref:hypothetical protein n=1 Tax=unclassified Bradyrhizobium TaxID=2631580 RepID=UPI003F890877
MTELVRYEAARKALAEAVAVDEVVDIRSKAEAMRVYARQASDKGLEIQAAQIRFRAERRLGELIVAQKETVGLNTGSRGQLQGKSDSGGAVVEQPEDERPRLADIGVDRKLSSKAQKLAAMDMAEFERALARHKEEMESGAGRVAMDLLKIDAEEKGRVHRRDLSSALASASALTPSGKKYPASYSDPPWVRKAGVGNRAYENHYATMPWPEILKYLERVAEAMQPDAWHWMWIPRAHLLARVPYKIEVMLADGEVVMATADLPLAYACQLALGMDSYSTCYVWTKTDEDHPDESGTGLLVWDQDELLLQFKRGRGLPKPASDEKFGSNHRERKREHSRKPDHYRHMIATMVGKDSDGAPLPVLELFARVDAEHPLPANWDAWGNQAGVSIAAATSSDGGGEATATAEGPAGTGDHPAGHDSGPLDPERSTPTLDASRDPHCASDCGHAGDGRVRKEAGLAPGPSEPLYDHPAIAGGHVVTMTRDYRDSVSFSVATCQCGWTFRLETSEENCRRIDDAVDAHWLEVISKHESGRAAELPAVGGGVAVADTSSERASPAVSATDDRAPYDGVDVITIDQLAGSEWLAPAPFDPASLGEREGLTILSDFCHQRRDIAPDLGEFYRARGFSYFGGKEWSLTGKGWDRLRELQTEATPQGPRVELTEPFRAPQMSLFDAARQLEDAPPAEVVDGALQTRLPVDADELAEQLALLAVDADGSIDGDMARHLVGKDFLFATTKALKITGTGRAFLAQLVGPAAVQQQGEVTP